jgi:hypothetical protein
MRADLGVGVSSRAEVGAGSPVNREETNMSTGTTRYDPLGAQGAVDDPYTPGTAVANGKVSSTLDDLRAAAQASEEVAEAEFTDHYLYGPGKHLRLTCSTELEQSDWKRIQIAALPPAQRKKMRPDPRKIDEVVMYALLIGEQTKEIGVLQGDGDYLPMTGTFDDPELLAALGATEVAVAVHRVFGRQDAYVLRAGEELINACGFGDRRPGDPQDDEDPT